MATACPKDHKTRSSPSPGAMGKERRSDRKGRSEQDSERKSKEGGEKIKRKREKKNFLCKRNKVRWEATTGRNSSKYIDRKGSRSVDGDFKNSK